MGGAGPSPAAVGVVHLLTLQTLTQVTVSRILQLGALPGAIVTVASQAQWPRQGTMEGGVHLVTVATFNVVSPVWDTLVVGWVGAATGVVLTTPLDWVVHLSCRSGFLVSNNKWSSSLLRLG